MELVEHMAEEGTEATAEAGVEGGYAVLVTENEHLGGVGDDRYKDT